MPNEPTRISYDGYSVLEITPDADPVQAVKDIEVLAEYAGMHTGRFSRKNLQRLAYLQGLAKDIAEDVD